MKQIESVFLANDKNTSLREIDPVINSIQTNPIENAPWPAYNYKPAVKFTVAYAKDCIFLKYWVKEKHTQARYRQPNDPVYKDSCVEFFIALEAGEGYYNFEFNCLGTCLAGFGQGREQRKLLCEQTIRKIRTHTAIKTSAMDFIFSWELLLVIPFDVFYFHTLESLKDKTARVNFYKCGDDLPEPHYLAWNNITSASPDFHLPDFFGQIRFI